MFPTEADFNEARRSLWGSYHIDFVEALRPFLAETNLVASATAEHLWITLSDGRWLCIGTDGSIEFGAPGV